MSVHARGSKWQVRWRVNGRQRARLFADRDEAERFQDELQAQRQRRRVAAMLHQAGQPGPPQRVYVIRGADKVKIGVAWDVEARLAAMQIGSPVPLQVEWDFEINADDDAKGIERRLHRRYAKHRSHGEWFAAEPVLADLREHF